MMYLDTENAVVAHAHHVPGQLRWLKILVGIHGAARDLAAVPQALGVHLGLPEAPAPVLVRAAGRGDLVLGASEVGNLPALALVQRDLRADHLQPAAGVRVARHPQGRVLARVEHGVVPGLEHGGVDVEVVDDVLVLVPPSLGRGQLRVHVRRQHPVVEEVVVVLRGLVRHPHLAEPLDHAPADAPWQQRAQRGAMVGGEQLAVLLESQEHVALAVHGPTHVNRGAVGARLALRQLAWRTLEVHVAVFGSSLGNPDVLQQVAEAHACPDAVGYPPRAPVEANCLLGHVLLLAAIASADKTDGDADDLAHLARCNIVHGQLAGAWHAIDHKLVALPRDFGHRAMVANDVQGWGRYPARLLQVLHGRLRVERVAPCEPDHALVPHHPAVGGVRIAVVDHLGILPGRHLQAHRGHVGGQLYLLTRIACAVLQLGGHGGRAHHAVHALPDGLWR
mmetsp:Transcript_24664/g.65891  ORF Transcript_24664/g.65891 Transcript_24664/m.65891 type:complete len:450 (-) Transcript_24664:71-1420(-)